MQDTRLVFPLIYCSCGQNVGNLQTITDLNPNLTQTHSSELSELMERNFWFMIKTTRHAFPSVFCLSLDVTWSVLLLNLLFRHTYIHTRTALGGLTSQCVLRYTPRPTYPDSREWCCMPGPENCGGIDMLFIISFCINYISQNGKEERRNGRRGRGNLVGAVCLASHWICFALPQFSFRPGTIKFG